MWATRDKNRDRIDVWANKPRYVRGSVWIGRRGFFDGHLFCSSKMRCEFLLPGQCVEIEDIKLVRKAKPIKVKHNFKFSEPGAKLEGDGIKGKRRAVRR